MTGSKNDTIRRGRASYSKEHSKGRLVRTQIQLDERQAERLKAVAASRGLSMAEWIRRAVDSALLSGGLTDKEEQRRRAIAAAGRFDSGITDISVEHDKYLAEAFGDHLPSSERMAHKLKDRTAHLPKKDVSS
jgi:hypothetical protein